MKLRPWQPPMIEHIHEYRRCAIFAGVGSGKTYVALKALDEKSLVEDVYPCIIFSTKRVAKDTWVDEGNKWEELKHIRIVSAVGEEHERKLALQRKAECYCINYENIPWLMKYLEGEWPFKTIIADELTKLRGLRIGERTSTTGKKFLNGQGTLRAKELAKIAYKYRCGFIGLTGTPAPNGLLGLWGQIWFIDFGERLGRVFEGFKRRWFTKSYDGHTYEPQPFAQGQIQDRIKDVCLSIDIKDYIDLKEPFVANKIVTLPDAAMKLYKDMEKKMFVQIKEHGIEAFNAASRTGKCQQIADGAIYTDEDAKNWEDIHTAKLDALEEIVEEYNGFPVLVAYAFRHDLYRLQKRFPHALDLSKDKNLKAFKTGKHVIGLGHPASLAHGIDGLQNVTNVGVHFGQSWDLELYDQFNGRIGPMRQYQAGMNRTLILHHIVAKNTVDELMMKRRATKRSVQDILMEAMKRDSSPS